jgi:hypothetical protein
LAIIRSRASDKLDPDLAVAEETCAEGQSKALKPEPSSLVDAGARAWRALWIFEIEQITGERWRTPSAAAPAVWSADQEPDTVCRAMERALMRLKLKRLPTYHHDRETNHRARAAMGTGFVIARL